MARLTDDELRALVDGATPGPWLDIQPCGEGWRIIGAPGIAEPIITVHYYDGVHVGMADGDARLIAAAPGLAREVLELRAEVARLRGEASESVANWRDPDAIIAGLRSGLITRDWIADNAIGFLTALKQSRETCARALVDLRKTAQALKEVLDAHRED